MMENTAVRCNRLRFAALLSCITMLHSHASAETAKGGHESHQGAAPARSGTPPKKPWTDLPIVTPGGGRAERGQFSLVGLGVPTEQLSVFSPGKPDSPRVLDTAGGRWLISPEVPGTGGHHWLMARGEQIGKIVTASTIVTFPAKGDAPTKLLNQSRGGLEILPQIVPEHGGVREGETWKFLVRFDHQPLANAVVRIETENGTKSQSVSDNLGVVKIAFPRDYNPAQIDPKAGSTRTRKGFVLAVEHKTASVTHLTGYNYFYYPDLMRERNLMAGFGFLAFGMLLATPLLRRKEDKNA